MNSYLSYSVKCTFAAMNPGTNNCEWFESWFDSRYYPLLYANRNDAEAKDAVLRMAGILNLPDGARVLDLACGRGRHAIVLSSLKFDVTGVDLSVQSIKDASLNENEHLHFYVHDMRRPVAVNYFDAVFNFFTSFGYFSSELDNVRTLNAVASSLKSKGRFVLDYFNPELVKRNVALAPTGKYKSGEIEFAWIKRIENNFCIKDIEVRDGDVTLRFEERVQLFSFDDMIQMLNDRFDVVNVYGDYRLNSYDAEVSDRMIFYCKKR